MVLGAVSEPVVSQQDAVLTAVRAWEAQNLRALQEEEARAQQEQEQEQLLTYTREDAYNAVRTPSSRHHRRVLSARCMVSGPVLLFPSGVGRPLKLRRCLQRETDSH